MTEEKKISIIVPSYNEEKNISRCLTSLLRVDYSPQKKEIILVDNGSTDSTVSIALNIGVRVIVKKGVNVGELRNIGVDESKGDIFAFLDADCSVDRSWCYEALSIFKDEDIGVTGSCLLPPHNGNWIEKIWGTYLYKKSSDNRDALYINSGNFFIKKEAFLAVEGFSNELVSSEDTDICNRINKAGYKIYYNNKIKAIHWGYPKTIFSFMRREVWHGVGATETNIGNIFHSKPLCLAFYNIILLSITFLFLNRLDIALFCLGILILPYLIVALRSCFKGVKIIYFPGLFFLLVIYGLSRSVSLLFFLYKYIVTIQRK